MRARDHVGDDFFVGVPDVRLTVDVVDRGCDIKPFAHYCTYSGEQLTGWQAGERSCMLRRMILVTSNPAQQLLYFKYVGKVTAEEMRARMDEVRGLLTILKPGFRLLGDFENLDSMDDDCVGEIGRVMDLLKTHGIELVVRVIPDAHKDIGLNILSVFHYGRSVRAVTCDTIEEAIKMLKI
jgi:hypothetical protein